MSASRRAKMCLGIWRFMHY
uniref:Uncharacterized protein n=1 Tax=Arundo donax TaxID=35708 RepID=A0A0A8Z433_ARUDO